MKIIKSINDLSKLVLVQKNKGKRVGLVVGAFDVMHLGHINLFRLAKKHVDTLIVGLDNDKTLKITKGEKRPINNYYRRSQFLSELSLVDYVFKIGRVFKHGDTKSSDYFLSLYKKIGPTHIFTHTETDSQGLNRKRMAKVLSIKFIPDATKTVTHTSDILKKLESEM